MPLLDVIDDGMVSIRVLLDEDDNVVDAIGPDAEMLEDMRRRGNATGNTVIATFGRTSSIVRKDGDEMIPLADDEKTANRSAVDSMNAALERMRRNRAKGRSKSGKLTKHYRDDDSGDDVEVGKIGELAKVDPDKRQVFGWAYVSHNAQGNVVVDKSGEFIDDVAELEDAAYTFVVKSRVGGADHRKDLMGTPVRVGTMIESVVFTPEKIAKMGIPEGVMPIGWWVGFQVEDEQTWQDVKDGKKLAFSIQGTGVRKEV